MARVSREFRKPSLRDRVPMRRWLVAAAAVLVAAFVGFTMFQADSVSSVARILAARGDVSVVGAGPSVTLAGLDLPAGAVIESGEDAEFVVEIADRGDGPDVGSSRLECDGLGRLVFAERAIGLERGTCRVSIGAEPLRLERLADASAELAAGYYDLSVTPRRRFDHMVSEPLMAVRLEVLEGAATILRGGALHEVRSGQVAHFGHWRALEIEGAPTPELISSMLRLDRPEGRTTSETVTEVARAWRGRVVDDATGLGVDDAEVRVDLGGRTTVVRTDVDGTFALPSSSQRLCILAVDPPAGSELTAVERRPTALPAPGGSLETIRLGTPRTVFGVVLDHRDVPVVRARVVPCIVDDVFGMCELREDLAVFSDEAGQFALAGVPSIASPHESVTLVVEHSDQPTTAYRIRPAAIVANAGLEVRMDEPRTLSLKGLPASRRVQVYQSVRGLAASSFSVRREIRADSAGSATLPNAGSGQVWLFDRSRGVGVPLVAVVENGVHVLRRDPTGEQPTLSVAQLGGAREWVGRVGRRFAAFRALPNRPTSYLTVIGRDAIVVPGTRLFVLAAGQDQPEFLGEYNGIDGFPFVAPDGSFTIIAIGPDGSVGWQAGADLVGEYGSIQMESTGAVEFDVGDEPVAANSSAMLKFRMVDGPLQGQEFWRVVEIVDTPRVDGLLPGSYVIEFDGGHELSVAVQPDGQVQVGLPVGARIR